MPIEVVTVTPNPAIDWTLTIPEFAAGKVNRVERHRQNAGGKGVNVAATLAAFDLRVAAAGFLGEQNAEPFEALFASLGILDRFLRIPGETRVGIKIVDPLLQETTDVNFPGAPPRPAEVDALRRQLLTLTADRPWFVLAGSLPPGMEPTLYRELTLTLRERGCRVLVDASGAALRYAVDAAPDVIKPNIHELEALVGASLPDLEAVARAARGLVRRGVSLVAVSMGADGALFVGEDRQVHVRPPAVEVRSTVGAGDAMVAGIVAGHSRRLGLGATARLATAFSMHRLAGGGWTTLRETVESCGDSIRIDESPGTSP